MTRDAYRIEQRDKEGIYGKHPNTGRRGEKLSLNRGTSVEVYDLHLGLNVLREASGGRRSRVTLVFE